jgi:hypothetical protein
MTTASDFERTLVAAFRRGLRKGITEAMHGRHDQPSLPFQKHSDTSVDAAEKAEPTAGTKRLEVYEFFVSIGRDGATDEQVQVALGMNPSTERPRRIELVNSGLVFDSGSTRLTRSGCRATVWKSR